ncbi:MAG: phosphatidylglycerophosphatase A [Methanobacterium sp.]|uniref:phosphatidylglycerophosphatase A n=1 Tax=Methanobacterium sp. TaxID=2164 RepID=UPI003D65A8D1|nr:phosphatidylglycerophosphatase A [Methanobacterium sp.]
MNTTICIDDASFLKNNNNIIIQREKGLLSLSNSNNEGFFNVKTIINHSINNNKEDTFLNKEMYLQKFLNDKKVSDPAAVILTSANMKHCSIETSDYVTAIVTAHNSGLFGAGENIKPLKEHASGSINIIILINKKLNNMVLMNTYSQVISAKIAALWDLDVRSPSWDLATSSSHDSTLVACLGDGEEDINETELQNLVENCVRKAVKKSMINSGFSKNVVDFIEGIEIKIEDLVDAGMELCVGVEKTEELYKKLHKQILKSLDDLNVVSFIIAGIRLEEDYMKHRVEGVDVDDDPAYLYSDEVFGMSIANQIAGTKAIFNFKRYDEEKPGIISTLGPVLDDVFAGLVAGCMSKIFEV